MWRCSCDLCGKREQVRHVRSWVCGQEEGREEPEGQGEGSRFTGGADTCGREQTLCPKVCMCEVVSCVVKDSDRQ